LLHEVHSSLLSIIVNIPFLSQRVKGEIRMEIRDWKFW
jgi:hypothetical protein